MPHAQTELHAVHRLFDYRQSLATKPYASRGMKVSRCRRCLLPEKVCTCAWRKPCQSQAAFALVMYDAEVLKPSNSGRLIADLIPDTHAFLWSRTQPDQQLIALLSDDRYQPYLVFPGEYAQQQRVINDFTDEVPLLHRNHKTPLFVLLDGCWREAVKMFRKSPYLQHLPMLSFQSDMLANYRLRKGKRDFQLGTAEVASLVLQAFGETANAEALAAWFDLFVECTLWSRSQNKWASLERIDELRQRVAQR
ncbi:tRNA-uridine aminocarboxypropyltransferase [Shewanella mangrovi]|uniref:tRNA-uridine aminocarboxypropyltransferase n=1 Tax=Shewanella mangrovi TaxID=1515746 RepID=UPI00055E1ED8|nr:tRNA-uridine aminocarboxypropyltransferase [Shewanella mangrovi]